jgi:hypothetical protein
MEQQNMTTANDSNDGAGRVPWWKEVEAVMKNQSLPLFDGDARMIQQEEMRRIAERIQTLANEQGSIGCELRELGQSIARLAGNTSRDIAHLHTLQNQLMCRIGQLEEQLKNERFMGGEGWQPPAAKPKRNWFQRVLGMRVIE